MIKIFTPLSIGFICLYLLADKLFYTPPDTVLNHVNWTITFFTVLFTALSLCYFELRRKEVLKRLRIEYLISGIVWGIFAVYQLIGYTCNTNVEYIKWIQNSLVCFMLAGFVLISLILSIYEFRKKSKHS